jgi:multiple sugar transport system permease protein
MTQASAAPQAMRTDGLIRRIVRARHAYLFLAPFLFFFLAFTILPILLTVVISFQDVGIRTTTWVGLDNYADLADDAVFWRAVVNSIVVTAVVVPVATIVSLAIAAIAVTLPMRWQSLARGGFYLPAIASALVLTMVWLWILHPVHGILNWVISPLGIGPIEWLGRSNTALASVMLVVLSFSLGQPVILFIAALNGIPREIYEAARLDGATAFREFVRISVPLVRPVLALVVIILTLGTFQIFVIVKVMTLGGPANATQSLVFRIWQLAFTRGDFGAAAAIAVVLLVIGLGIAIFQMRFISTDVTYS